MRGQIHSIRRGQEGATLVVGLVILALLSLIVLSGIGTSLVEERMAGNFRDRSLAFQAAESALRDAEAHITKGVSPFDPFAEGQFVEDCTNGYCRSSPASPKWSGLSVADWTGNKAHAYGSATGAANLPLLASQPRYVIEYQGSSQPIEQGRPCEIQFLVTARATGTSNNTVVILQTQHRHRAGLCQPTI